MAELCNVIALDLIKLSIPESIQFGWFLAQFAHDSTTGNILLN